MKRKHNLEYLNTLVQGLFLRHSALKFDKPDFTLAKNGNAIITNAAPRLTPDKDSELDIYILKDILEHYDDKIQSFLKLNFQDGELEVSFSTSENWIFYYIHYTISKGGTD